jgi:hypothetical protein
VLTAAVVLVMAAVPSRNGRPADIDRWGCCCAQCYIVSACSNRLAPTLRKKPRKYPGLNTPLGIPGVFFGVFPLLVHFWPFWGYFAWCIPKVTAPKRGTFALKRCPQCTHLIWCLLKMPQGGPTGSGCWGSSAPAALAAAARQLYRCGVARQWLPAPMRRHQAQPEGLWGISNGVFLSPWGDLTCAAGGGVLWGIPNGVFRCPPAGTIAHSPCCQRAVLADASIVFPAPPPQGRIRATNAKSGHVSSSCSHSCTQPRSQRAPPAPRSSLGHCAFVLPHTTTQSCSCYRARRCSPHLSSLICIYRRIHLSSAKIVKSK